MRFQAPLKPLIDRSTVDKGEVGRICPQAFPVWYLRMLAGFEGNEDAIEKAQDDPNTLIPPPDPREQEDCLFLDVIVPENIWDRRDDGTYPGAPVMVWFYGGGFTFTDASGNPAGIIAESKQSSAGSDGVIYVKMNYRVSSPLSGLTSAGILVN